MKYNRLELLLLGFTNEDFMKYQPLLKDYGVYMVGSTSIISYGKRLSAATKKEIIQNIANKKVKIYEESKWTDGFFKWWECAYGETVVTFSFFHAKRGYEDEALDFILNGESITYEPVFGLLEDGTIINKRQTLKLVSEIEDQQSVAKLEAIANCKYKPTNNPFEFMHIEMWISKQFGEVKTLAEINQKYKELVNIHHPDKGGCELMFRAITSAKEYLKEKLL